MHAPHTFIVDAKKVNLAASLTAQNKLHFCLNPIDPAACGCPVVEKETGRIKALKLVAARDMGQAINPIMCLGQIEGGVAHGLSSALEAGSDLG